MALALASSPGLAVASQSFKVVLSWVPGYTTQLGMWLWGRYSLSQPGSKANCSTFMPGRPLSARSRRTLSNNRPRSSATMGSSPRASSSARNSAMPGPCSHLPSRAVVASAGMAQ